MFMPRRDLEMIAAWDRFRPGLVSLVSDLTKRRGSLNRLRKPRSVCRPRLKSKFQTFYSNTILIATTSKGHAPVNFQTAAQLVENCTFARIGLRKQPLRLRNDQWQDKGLRRKFTFPPANVRYRPIRDGDKWLLETFHVEPQVRGSMNLCRFLWRVQSSSVLC
jgi:hypothetical protein